MANSVLLGTEGSQQMPLEGSAIDCSQSLTSIQEDKAFSNLSIIFLFLGYFYNSE
jgi:hypothetical protein